MSPTPSLAAGRLLVVAAALLWSTSGAFTKLLREETPLGLNVPLLDPEQLAAARVFFAGIVLVPLLRRRDVSYHPAMILTALTYAAMNYMFVRAMAEGKAASAILLQYTAPLWMYLASVWFLGEPSDRRAAISLGVGLVGVALIITDGWQLGNPVVVLLGLGSGVTYAGIMIGLRMMRSHSSLWLTVVNNLTAAVLLGAFFFRGPLPTWPQVGVLAVFGATQLGLPYVLVARGLRSVSPQEAGTLTLLEPLLNPVWAYLVSPATEKPGLLTLTGGAIILGGLAWRYWPRRQANLKQAGEPKP